MSRVRRDAGCPDDRQPIAFRGYSDAISGLLKKRGEVMRNNAIIENAGAMGRVKKTRKFP
jgi:hypothetical protein